MGKGGGQASSAQLKKVSAGSSGAVKARSDYDGGHAHKYGFTLICKSRNIDVIAPSALVYNIWVEGLQCLRRYATEVAGADQKKSGCKRQHRIEQLLKCQQRQQQRCGSSSGAA